MQDLETEQVNADYEPTDDDEELLEVMKDEPCGRVTPFLLRERTGLSKQRVSNSLRQLVASGWVNKPYRGLYDLDEDPEMNRDESASQRLHYDTMAALDYLRAEKPTRSTRTTVSSGGSSRKPLAEPWRSWRTRSGTRSRFTSASKNGWPNSDEKNRTH